MTGQFGHTTKTLTCFQGLSCNNVFYVVLKQFSFIKAIPVWLKNDTHFGKILRNVHGNITTHYGGLNNKMVIIFQNRQIR
jgi:hypothetical protein